MLLDLDKASQALSGLKDPQRARALDTLHQDLVKFRASLGIDLNDAEFRYVMQTLFNEQVVTVPPTSAIAKQPAMALAHGFTIRAAI